MLQTQVEPQELKERAIWGDYTLKFLGPCKPLSECLDTIPNQKYLEELWTRQHLLLYRVKDFQIVGEYRVLEPEFKCWLSANENNVYGIYAPLLRELLALNKPLFAWAWELY